MSSSSSSNSTIDVTSPLYLHPSDGANSVNVEKLQGASNNRAWRRLMEIALASKRKLGFVTGGVKRDATDKVKQDCWDTCNSMVISWILSSVTDNIRKSVMFMNDASEIWMHLQSRFSITNGAKKYSLNKQIYETKQQNRSISEYYTEMKALWVELETLNMIPAITSLNPEINAFIKALNDQKEELKLFQLLSGIDDEYSAQRSQILMLTKLPTVEEACNMIQQEETQREVFKQAKDESEVMAMHTKKNEMMCGNCGKTGHTTDRCWACKACGKSGHTSDKCWTVIGYPPKNNKGFRDSKMKGKEFSKGGYSKEGVKANQKWTKGKGRMAANVSGLGKEVNGVYCMINEDMKKMLSALKQVARQNRSTGEVVAAKQDSCVAYEIGTCPN
ncbi:Gag-Pol polyprotein [Bienertia sinuspersici]